LGYNKDAAEVIDTVFEGVKQHIRTHYALEQWGDFRAMKTACVLYNEAYFAQNRKTEGRDFKGKGKRPQRAEAAVTGSGLKRLSDKDWEMCRIKGFCFVCKKIGKDVLGLAKEHPNHPPKERRRNEEPKTKKVDNKRDSKKKNTVSVKATDVERDSDVDRTEVSDSDSEDQTGESKN